MSEDYKPPSWEQHPEVPRPTLSGTDAPDSPGATDGNGSPSSRGSQVLYGFFTYWLLAIMAVVACFAAPDIAGAVCLVGVGLMVAAPIIAHKALGWQFFLRGMVTGFLVMIGVGILGVGACFAIVAGMRFG